MQVVAAYELSANLCFSWVCAFVCVPEVCVTFNVLAVLIVCVQRSLVYVTLHML